MLKERISIVTCFVFSIFVLHACHPGEGRMIALKNKGSIDDQLKELSQSYLDTIKYCQKQLDGLEQQRNGISYWLIGVAVLGAALGAAGGALLAVSTANSGTAAFLSSGAGVASGIQPTMKEHGISAETYKARYDTAIAKLQEDTKNWGTIPITNDANEVQARVSLLGTMLGHCSFLSDK